MIPPMLLNTKRGENIVDMCGAPGSKTAQFLESFYIFNENEIERENCLKEYNLNNCKNTSNDDGPIRNNIF